MKNRFNLNEEEKNRIRGLHLIQVINEQDPNGGDGYIRDSEESVQGLDEQPEVDGNGDLYLDQNQDVKSQVDSLQASNHKSFMDGVHSMCDKIEGMGDKSLGRRKCDGNKTDGSGGCYEPLIKLVKEYCKSK
tara:strand:- start:1174 stop:1569 length:396 start_codon:yes stop_codon:yes gene_type:complete